MSDNILEIKAGEDTPYVLLERKQGFNSIVIKGVSMPENVLDFYHPLFEQINSFFGNDLSGLHLEISLKYMNSMSNKQIMKLIRNLSHKDSALKITWNYQPKDALMKLKGEEIKSVLPNINMLVAESAG